MNHSDEVATPLNVDTPVETAEVPPATSAEIPVEPWEVAFLVPLSLQWQCDEDGRRIPVPHAAALPLAQGVTPTNDDWAREITALNENWICCDSNYPQLPDSSDQHEQALAYAEFCYLHPIIRNFLFTNRDEMRAIPKSTKLKLIAQLPIEDQEQRQNWKEHLRRARNNNLRILKRLDLKEITVDYEMRLQEGSERSRLSSKFTVHSCWLYLFDTGIAMLEVRLQHDRAELADTKTEVPLTARMVMHLQDCLRRLYPTYWYADGTAGHCPTSVSLKVNGQDVVSYFGDNHRSGLKGSFIDHVALNREPLVARWWQAILNPLKPIVTSSSTDATNELSHMAVNPLRYELIEDERTVTFSFIGVPNPRELSSGDWQRLAELDDEGASNTCSYSPEFVDNPIQQFAYDRYYHSNGQLPAQDAMHNLRWMCSGYGFLGVGKTSDKDFFRDSVIGAHGYFRRHYFSLGLIAHLQRASLLRFKHELAETMEAYNPQARTSRVRRRYLSRIGDLLDRMNHFRAVYWTREVSNQVQGRELFDLWKRQLDLEPLFNEVYADAQFANELLMGWSQERQADAAGYLSWLGAAFLIVGPVLALWSEALAEQPILNSLLLLIALSTLCIVLAFMRRAALVVRDEGPTRAWLRMTNQRKTKVAKTLGITALLVTLCVGSSVRLAYSVVETTQSNSRSKEAERQQLLKAFSSLEAASQSRDAAIEKQMKGDESLKLTIEALVNETKELQALLRPKVEDQKPK